MRPQAPSCRFHIKGLTGEGLLACSLEILFEAQEAGLEFPRGSPCQGFKEYTLRLMIVHSPELLLKLKGLI